MAEGKRLVAKEYDNVVETIPLTARGTDQDKCIKTIRELLQLGRQAADYWTEIYEFDDVWWECKPACNDCLTGYVRIIKMSIPELSYPFGQPFFTGFSESIMDGLTLTIEREPLWRGVAPGELVGPLYNLLRNPDFELWNFGVGDSQPDSWSDLETIQITGTNNRDDAAPHSGNYDLKIRVSGSTLTGRVKGITQVASGIRANTEYTVVAWVRSEGVSNGVGRILVTYSSQLEVYRSAAAHGWTLYTGKFTTGESDVVAISLEILTTAANTDGTVYFDSLMLLEGDWEQEAIDGVLPYISSSHIVNHWDTEAGDINFVDAWAVPGDEDALVRLEILNNTSPTEPNNPTEVYGKLRVGMRRSGEVFNFQNYFDPAGLLDTTASSDDRVVSPALEVEWKNIITQIITNNILDNQGRFRVFARVYDTLAGGNPSLEIRLRYFIGTAGINEKVLESVSAPIRSNWCIANLTQNASVNFDRKFASDLPGQLGYTIQLRRATATDEGYIDYVLTMPTDGGYFEAELDPGLFFENFLIFDGINQTDAAIANKIITGWHVVYQMNNQSQLSIQAYNGALYVGGGDGEIDRFKNGRGTTALSGSGNILALETFNGMLYYNGSISVRETDGTTFPTQIIISSGGGIFKCIKGFRGYLYAGQNTVGRIWRWDGSAASIFFDPAETEIKCMEVYNNRLYVGVGNVAGTDGKVYEYDPISNSWNTLTLPDAVLDISALAVFNGKLYAASGFGDAYIFAFDGNSFTRVYTDTPVDFQRFNALKSFQGKIYAGGFTPTSTSPIIASEDGITWEIVLQTLAFEVFGFEELDGVLYVATGASVGSVSNLYASSTGVEQYKVTNWQGIPFRSPPTKRHRFCVSYDRTDLTNNIDDAALVGLGFVPRYLALRGHG